MDLNVPVMFASYTWLEIIVVIDMWLAVEAKTSQNPPLQLNLKTVSLHQRAPNDHTRIYTSQIYIFFKETGCLLEPSLDGCLSSLLVASKLLVNLTSS